MTEPTEQEVERMLYWLRHDRGEGYGRIADMLESLSSRLAAERKDTERRKLALERARGCIKGLLARTPVRDVTETLAEIDAAIAESTK